MSSFYVIFSANTEKIAGFLYIRKKQLHMPDYLLHFITYSGLLIGVMLIAEASYRWLHLPSEWTRKIAHIGSGIVALSYPDVLNNHWVVFALTVSFTIILYTSKKMGLFGSIFSVGRKSYGELFFVWSSWLLFWLFQYTGSVIYFYLPFSIVVFADPAAALVGKNFPIKRYLAIGNQKSFGGSLAFFIIALALSYYFFQQAGIHYFIWLSFLHASALTVVEAISFKGSDNLTIPLISVFYIYLFI